MRPRGMLEGRLCGPKAGPVCTSLIDSGHRTLVPSRPLFREVAAAVAVLSHLASMVGGVTVGSSHCVEIVVKGQVEALDGRSWCGATLSTYVFQVLSTVGRRL